MCVPAWGIAACRAPYTFNPPQAVTGSQMVSARKKSPSVEPVTFYIQMLLNLFCNAD